MKIRHGFAILAAAAGASLVMGAAPAFADGRPVPSGCSFDRAIGVLTCVTTTTATSTVGPITTNGWVDASTTFGGFTGVEICDVGAFRESWKLIAMRGISLVETVSTTTTIERHGLHGKVFDTSTSTSTTLTHVQLGTLVCST